MAVTIPTRGSVASRSTLVYEFFDARVLGHLWFIALTDGSSVQLLVPTFRSEQAAKVFERCVLEHPTSALLTLDGQLELGRRIESHLAAGGSVRESEVSLLCEGLPFERDQENPLQ